MDFRFTETQGLFAGAVGELLDKECTPATLRAMTKSNNSSIQTLWVSLSNMGVVGMTGPEGYGGLGMSDLDLDLIMEEIGRVACPETIIEQTCIGVPILSNLIDGRVDEGLIKSLRKEIHLFFQQILILIQWLMVRTHQQLCRSLWLQQKGCQF